jgi:predicted MFS family arabinose efflux permease
MGIPSEGWRVTFAVIGAVAVGGTAWVRMALFVPPEAGRRIEGGPATHRLAGAARQG